MPGQKSAWTLRDATGENTVFAFPMGAITAVSLPGFLTEFGAMRTAIDNLTLGTLRSESWTGDNTRLDDTTPSNPAAQRELGLRVFFIGNSGSDERFVTLGTVDPSKLAFTPGAADYVALDASQEVEDFITAFEQIARHPNSDLETVTVTKLRLVGRAS